MSGRIRLLCVAVAGLVALGAAVAQAAWLTDGSGAASAAAGAVASGPTPSAALAANKVDVDVTWNDLTRADGSPVPGYQLNRENESGVVQTMLAACAGTLSSTSCTESLVPEGRWVYRVRGVDGSWSGSDGSASTVVAVPPRAPTGVSAQSLSQTTIRVSWVDASSTEAEFRVERSADGLAGWTHIGTASADATSYDDAGLACETTAHYRVLAVHGTNGSSLPGGPASATTSSCTVTPPGGPGDLTAAPAAASAGSTTIDLAWSDNSEDESGFEVERSDNGTTGWTLLHTTAADVTSYSDDTLTCGSTRYYRVRAVTGSTSSTYTNVVGAQTCPIHIAELGGSAASQNDNFWRATVTITVRDSAGNLIGGASVTGVFTDSAGANWNCTTESAGTCSIQSGNVSKSTASTTFTVSGVSHSARSYRPSSNVATSVTVTRP